MTPLLRNDPRWMDRVCGIIDHHALATSFNTSKPIYMDLRPWGSMSTIVTVLFLQHRRYLPAAIAKVLLMAVLSDTLNLQSVTTTDADRQVVALLSSYSSVENPDDLARTQFQAKTDWIVNLGAYEMVRGDQKDFEVDDWKCGISVLEVTDPAPVLRAAPEIMLELRLLKKEKGLCPKTKVRDRRAELDFAFLFIVDIIKQQSSMIICGGRELALARAAFPAELFPGVSLGAVAPDLVPPGKTISSIETLMQMPAGWVSRKAQFAPRFLGAMSGFTCHKRPCKVLSLGGVDEAGGVDEDPDDGEFFSEALFQEALEGGWDVVDSYRVERSSSLLKRMKEKMNAGRSINSELDLLALRGRSAGGASGSGSPGSSRPASKGRRELDSPEMLNQSVGEGLDQMGLETAPEEK